ncbi:DNA/RNA helicase domain-containing protein [Alkalihalophilus marmarensis]
MNPRQLRLNSYRVLLTRGREGVIVYIPDESLLDETYKVFLKSGAIKLGN